MQWLEAEATREASEKALRETEEALDQAYAERTMTAEDEAHRHAWSLRQEMQRRAKETELAQETEAAKRREVLWRHANKDRRVVQQLAENREQDSRDVAAHRAQRLLDDVGMRSWWRRHR